tara:strand:- start:2510 stop:3763 length:1254 start_codon:yes stop_codon:yes gene_type:complete
MKPFFFQRSKVKGKLAVIFDIGSASVGAALVGFAPDTLPKIFYTTRREIPFLKKIEAERLTASMLKTLELVAHDIQKEGFSHARFTLFGSIKPALVSYFLASPWHVSQVRDIYRQEEESFRVDRDLVRELVSHEMDDFKKLHGGSGTVSFSERDGETKQDNLHEKHTIIEGDILDIKLNRYHVADPLGKTARELDMTLFVSSAPQTLIRSIGDVGDREFSGTESRLSSFTFSFFNTVRDIWHDKENFLLIDISGEVTDLSIIKEGRILETASFPVGRNTILRNLSSKHISFNEAESLLNLYYQNKIGTDEAAYIKSALQSAQDMWLQLFAKELQELASQILFPNDIFLVVDAPLDAWFKEVITSDKLYDLSTTGEPFDVILLDTKTLAPYCQSVRWVDKDPFLIVESLFLNKTLFVI